MAKSAGVIEEEPDEPGKLAHEDIPSASVVTFSLRTQQVFPKNMDSLSEMDLTVGVSFEGCEACECARAWTL